MNIIKMNSYQKALAQLESKSPKIDYVATLKGLNDEYKKYLEPYNAEQDKDVKTGRNYNKHKYEKLNKTKPVKIKYTFYYLCEAETEEERLKKVIQNLNSRLNSPYGVFRKNFNNVSFEYGKNFTADIEKVVLED